MGFHIIAHIAHHTHHAVHLHTAHHAVHAVSVFTVAQVATSFFAGVAVSIVLYTLCRCLDRLVEAGILSQKQAEEFKSKASLADEKTQKEMLNDANELCEKWGI